MTEHTYWLQLATSPILFFDANRVYAQDLADLARAGRLHFGGVVAVNGDPRNAVHVIEQTADGLLGCIGGMISDAD